MFREEFKRLCEQAKKHPNVAKSGKSDYCIMVLELMDTEVYANDYCGALDAVCCAYPYVSRRELETELNKYI